MKKITLFIILFILFTGCVLIILSGKNVAKADTLIFYASEGGHWTVFTPNLDNSKYVSGGAAVSSMIITPYAGCANCSYQDVYVGKVAIGGAEHNLFDVKISPCASPLYPYR